MERWLSLLLLFALFSYAHPLGCSDATSSSQCSSLTACSWSGSACSGTFAPTCANTCYYIDPVSGSDSAGGSYSDPFLTLTKAFTALSGVTGTIYVINTAAGTEVNLLSPATVTSTLTLTSVFADSNFVMNLQSFDTTSSKTGITISSGKLTVNGCTFTSNSLAPGGMDMIFSLLTNLVFTNVDIKDSSSQTILVNAASTQTSSTFSYTGGTHSNAAFTFNLAAGTHTFTNVNFLNVAEVTSLMTLGLTMTFTNIHVSGGSSLFMTMVAQGTLTVTNITYLDYDGNFISSTTPKVITITNSLFHNIVQNTTQPFIYATGAGTFTAATPTITNTVFDSIAVRHSLFLIEQSAKVFTLTSVTMNNISKIALTKKMKNSVDLDYESAWPGGICLLSRVGTGYKITNSNFTNIKSHCIAVLQSVLTMSGCIFDNSDLSSEYTSSLKNTSLAASDGVTFLSFKDGTTDVNPGAIIDITSNTFINNVIFPLYGGAMRILGTYSLQWNMKGNKFIGLGALYGGAVYCENPLAVVTSISDVYTENTAINGGAINKNSLVTQTPVAAAQTLSIQSGVFESNVATGKGGSIYLNWETIAILDTSFTGNSAQNGGAIYFISENPNTLSGSSISNGTFISNSASNSGGALKLLFDSSDIMDSTMTASTFTDNTDLFGLQISDGKPSYYMLSFYDVITTQEASYNEDYSTWISNPNKTTLSKRLNSSDFPSDFLIKHKSGHELSQIIHVEAYDSNDQLANYITDESITVKISDTQNSLSDFKAFVISSPVTATFKRGELFLHSTVLIIGQPTTSATLTLSGSSSASNILVDADALMSQDMQVYFTDCEIGDIYSSSTQMCSTCAKGTYSLDDPYSNPTCTPCDDAVAVCLGGAQIAPKPGYWRYDTLSSNFMECPQESACLGGYVNDIYSAQGECEFPYEGNLCNQCADTYAKFGSGTSCVNCKTSAMYYIKLVGFFAAQVVVLLFGIRTNITKITKVKKAQNDKELQSDMENEDFQSNLMKIAVNFLQVSSIITSYKFTWPKFITNFGNVTSKVVPDDKNGFSVDCVIAMITKNNDSIYWIKFVITLIEPFAIWFLLILGYTLYLKVKKEPLRGNAQFKRTIVVLFIITVFLFQPTIIQSTLEIFKCENFGSDENPIYFMTDNSETQCWTSHHLLWGCAVAIPVFFIWTIFMPMMLFNVLRKRAKNLHDPEIYAKYSFVYEGLKNERYYWEFLIIGRKTLVIIVYVFLNFVSIQSQAFATFLIVAGFTTLHYFAWPYTDKRLNNVEMMSMITLCVMVYSGMFFLSDGGNEWLNTILVVISGIFNIALYGFLALLFIKSYRQTAIMLKRKAKLVGAKLKEMKNNFQEKRKTSSNRSATSNSTSSDKRKNNTVEGPALQDLSLVLNKIQVGDSLNPELNSPDALFTPDLSLRIEPLYPVDKNRYRDNEGDSEDVKDEGESIPTEYSDKILREGQRSKTVFNADRSDVDNCSVLRSSHYRSKTHRNTGSSVNPPDNILNELNVFRNEKKSSLTSDLNSHEMMPLGRTFSAFERRGTLVREDSSKQNESQQLTPRMEKKHTIIHEEPSDTHLL